MYQNQRMLSDGCPMASLHFGVKKALTFHNEAYIENGEHNARTDNALSD